MIVRSGNAPTVIENFSRGYRPLIEQSDRATEIYHSSFLASVSRIARRGFMKSYVTLTNPPKWRGRLLVSETARRFAAKGVRYDGAFDCKTLSFDIPENQALKATLREVSFWLKQKAMNEELTEANGFLRAFAAIKDWQGPIERLIADIPQLAKTLPSHLSYYREPLWTSYAILQGGIPDIASEGYFALDSMIVNVSAVFEEYARKAIVERARGLDLKVRDGNKEPMRFFSDGDEKYKVRPDIILEQGGEVVAILDVKYKQTVKESDRYQMLAFMEAAGAPRAAFVCPTADDEIPSHYMGRTPSGRHMAIIKIDLASEDFNSEEEKIFYNVLRLVQGRYDFVH